jgi:hypothetical protein
MDIRIVIQRGHWSTDLEIGRPKAGPSV